MSPTTLLAKSENIKRRFTRKPRKGASDDKPLPPLPSIPEVSSAIVREERGWNVGSGKPLPSLPSPVETVTSPGWYTANSPMLSTASIPDTLRVATTANVTTHPPPTVVSVPKPMVSPLLALKTDLPQEPTGAPPRLIRTPVQPVRPPPARPSRSAPQPRTRTARKVPPTPRRLKSRDTSTRLRDAFNGTEASHIPAVPPPTIERKPLPSSAFPAYMSLPSQVEELAKDRAREAGEAWQRTKAQWSQRKSPIPEDELFLNTSTKVELVDRGELPSSLKPPGPSRAQDLTRISTMFNRLAVTEDENSLQGGSPTSKSYTAYSPAASEQRGSTKENPLMSYAAHQARRNTAVEFNGRTHPATSTYTTNNAFKITSQVQPHYVPEDFMDPAPSRTRTTTPENGLSELPTGYNMTSKSCHKPSVEFVSANSNRNASSVINKGKGTSILELSKNFNVAEQPYDGTPIELEANERPAPRVQTQDYNMSARVSTVGLYDQYELPQSVPSAIHELADTSIDNMPARELPDLKRLSAMSFDGTVLETVMQNS